MGSDLISLSNTASAGDDSGDGNTGNSGTIEGISVGKQSPISNVYQSGILILKCSLNFQALSQ